MAIALLLSYWLSSLLEIMVLLLLLAIQEFGCFGLTVILKLQTIQSGVVTKESKLPFLTSILYIVRKRSRASIPCTHSKFFEL